jgi:hypothetical protein
MPIYLYLLCIHWFADFVLQTRWQAENKSKNNIALSRHVLVYTTVLFLAGFPLVSRVIMNEWSYFVLLNGILHFCTDYITSRITSRLYAKQDYHNFFVVIGLDQLIHQLTLAFTMLYFFY